LWNNLQKSNQTKINEKFKGDYLAMNIRETDIYEEGRNDGIALGITQGIAQGISQGIAQGAEQKAIETARNMLDYGDPLDKIATVTGLAVGIVEKLANEQITQNK